MSYTDTYENQPRRVVVAPDGSTSYWVPDNEAPAPTLSKPGPSMAAVAAWCHTPAVTRSDEQYLYLGYRDADCGVRISVASCSDQ